MRHKQENNLGKHGGLNTVNCNGTVVTSTMGKAVGQVTIGPRCVSFQVQSSIARCYHHGDDGTGVPFHCIVRSPVTTPGRYRILSVMVLYLKAQLFNKRIAQEILQHSA